MQTIATHFRYALLEAWAERRTSLVRLLQFIGIAFILGFAFNSAFQAPNFEKVTIGYVSEDLGEGGDTYFAQLNENEAFTDIASFREVDNFDDGQEQVQAGDLGALLFVEEDFSDRLAESEDQAPVQVFSMEYSGINYIVVRAVVDGFNSGANAAWSIQAMGEQLPADSKALSSSAIQEESLDNLRQVNGMTYYAVGMLLFLLLFGTEFGSFGISKEYLGTMQARTHLAPQRTWQLVVGKLSAYSLAVLLQGVIFMAVTGLVLGVDWLHDLPMILLIVYVFGIFAIALGMAIMMITRDMKKTTTIIQVAVLGFTFLGGGFIATDFFGAEFFSPNYYAREALFGVLYGDGVALAVQYVGILAALSVVLVGISAFASRRKVA